MNSQHTFNKGSCIFYFFNFVYFASTVLGKWNTWKNRILKIKRKKWSIYLFMTERTQNAILIFLCRGCRVSNL